MLVVMVAWIFFRAESFKDAWAVLSGIFAFRGKFEWTPAILTAGMSAWILLIDLPQSRTGEPAILLRWPWFLRGFLYATFILLMLTLERAHDAAFIYFQF
jgi:hypothetical protein